MLNLIKANFYLLKKSGTVKLLFLLSLVSALVMAGISHNMATSEVSQQVAGIGSFFADFQMVSLLGIIIASSLICSDFQSKIVQDSISCGNSRMNIIISKTIVYAISIGIILLPYVVISFIGFCTGSDFQAFLPSTFLNLMANEGDYSLSVSVFFKILALFIGVFTLYVGELSISVLLGYTLRKPAAVIGVGYIINLFLAKLSTVDGIKDILAYTPFGLEFFGKLELGCSIMDIIKPIIISLVFIVVVVFITNIIFKKSEVK